jgi:hypothetical protein
MRARMPMLFAVFLWLFFAVITGWQSTAPLKQSVSQIDARVVIAAPVLVVLFGSDRHFAANMEVIRLATTGVESGMGDADYLVRAQRVASDLNPCHEDNYYLANALLAWGSAINAGQEILLRASDCRSWDELPPFFFGFNKFFFERDIPVASKYLEQAAQRATTNAAGFRKFAIMLKAEEIEDERVALDFLRRERDQSRDTKLRVMLDRRVQRLEGLGVLRDAQRRYENKTGLTLQDANDLLQEGVLDSFPSDPLKLGYEFVGGRFMLKRLKVVGLEER